MSKINLSLLRLFLSRIMNTHALGSYWCEFQQCYTVADPGVWSTMSSFTLSISSLPWVFSKCWARGLLCLSHHADIISLPSILLDLGWFSHTFHEALHAPILIWGFASWNISGFSLCNGFLHYGDVPLSGLHRASTPLFCASMNFSSYLLISPYLCPPPLLMKYSSHRQLMAVSLVLI